MSWRTIVITNSAKLDYQMGFMVVRTRETTKIHIGEISTVIIETTAVSITAALLCELTKKKIKVIFCDEKRNPSSEVVPYYGSHDTSIKIRKQISWDTEQKGSIWTKIVSEKIRNQARLLEENDKFDEAKMLYQYIKEMRFADETNREGHAAKVYFNALFGMEFTRGDVNSINAALNYGYAIILSSFNREIVANGYITQIGLFHDNMYNYFNLSSDIMEPFRVIVDRKVKEMMPDKFERDEKLEVLKILESELLIAGRHEYVSNAIRIYCKSVFDAVNERDSSLLRFFSYEL